MELFPPPSSKVSPIPPFEDNEAERYFNRPYDFKTSFDHTKTMGQTLEKFRLFLDNLWKFGYDFKH